MPTFIAIYRGRTIGEARMVAVSADLSLVADVVNRLLDQPQEHNADPIVRAIDRGRVKALRMMKREHGDADI